MMKRTLSISGAALAALLTSAPRARAEVTLSIDAALGVPVDQTPQRYLSTGAGFDLRAGYRFRVPYQHVSFTPEILVGYTDLAANLIRIRPGLRVGIGRVLVPYAYGHIGWGYTSFDPLGTRDTAPDPVFTGAHGFSFDAGVGLDVKVLRRLSVGAQLGYNVLNVGSTPRAPVSWRAKWMSLGLGATFHL